MSVVDTKFMCVCVPEIAAVGKTDNKPQSTLSIWITLKSGATQNILYSDAEERDNDYLMLKRAMGAATPQMV